MHVHEARFDNVVFLQAHVPDAVQARLVSGEGPLPEAVNNPKSKVTNSMQASNVILQSWGVQRHAEVG